jgi:hypothetical protein
LGQLARAARVAIGALVAGREPEPGRAEAVPRLAALKLAEDKVLRAKAAEARALELKAAQGPEAGRAPV